MSTPSPSLIQRLQDDIATRLESYPLFATVPVIRINDRNNDEAVLIKARLDQALAGKTSKGGKAGLACLVMVPELSGDSPNLPGPQLRAECVVSVIEQPLINRGVNGTNILPEELALTVQRLLNHWQPNGRPFYAPPGNGLVRGKFDDKIAWEVMMEIAVANTPIASAPAPVISMAGNALTMAAPGADAIYYTLDGTLPSAATGTLYAGPFALEAPGTVWVRAVSTRAGRADSDVCNAHVEAS